MKKNLTIMEKVKRNRMKIEMIEKLNFYSFLASIPILMMLVLMGIYYNSKLLFVGILMFPFMMILEFATQYKLFRLKEKY